MKSTLSGLLLLSFLLPTITYGQQLYAIDECQLYNGPSRESGKFFFTPTATRALTLNKNEPYTILNERKDWLQVDVFGKTPWVRRNCMAEQLPQDNLKAIHKERLDSFNKLQSSNNRRHIHAGVKQNGNELILLVTDKWHSISSDMKETYVKESMMLFMGMGGARNIPEKPDDYAVEVRHSSSNRLLATWNSLWGFKLVAEK